jgi:hypothetical protein
MKIQVVLPLVALLATGCASYEGRGLVPGNSTEADVQRVMGQPAEKLAAAGGGSTWFYPHGPMGRDTYAVRIAPDGKVQAVEQVLSEANFPKLIPGQTTSRDAREVLGPPSRVIRSARQQREIWEYPYYNAMQTPYLLYVQFSGDGVLREVLTLRDPSLDAGTYPS